MPAVHLQENTKLISGHVAEKKGYLYWVLNITENSIISTRRRKTYFVSKSQSIGYQPFM